MQSLSKLLGQFGKTFWAAIAVELLHCLASYTMLAYLIVYLAQDLGFGDLKASALYGTMLFMGYFLPILIGALADRYGFRQTMVVSLVIITAGYLLMSQVTRYPWVFAAMMLIALGGAVMKPVIAGTVKATSTDENRSLAFSVYYMSINIGSSVAPFLANGVRLGTGNPAMIFVACCAVEASALLVTWFFFQSIPVAESARSKSLLTVLNEMVVVLGNLRLMVAGAGVAAVVLFRGQLSERFGLDARALVFLAGGWILVNLVWDLLGKSVVGQRWGQSPLLDRMRLGDTRLLAFILLMSGVWALYSQIWTNIPLYITALDPAMKERIEWFQAVDPIMIVCFQMLIGKWMGRYRPLPSMMVGILISAGAVSTVHLFGAGLGAWAVGISLAIWAVGEMMFSPRSVEYVSVIAPPDKLALYIGYGFLPFAIGFGFGPSVGAHLVKYFGETLKRPEWVWYAFGLWALLIAAGLWLYDRWVRAGDQKP